MKQFKLNLNNDKDWKVYNVICETIDYYVESMNIIEMSENDIERLTNNVWNMFLQLNRDLKKFNLLEIAKQPYKLNKNVEYYLIKFITDNANYLIPRMLDNNMYF